MILDLLTGLLGFLIAPLNVLIYAPAIAAVVIWCLPERRRDLIHGVALWVGVGCAVLSAGLWLQVTKDSRPGKLVGEYEWGWVVIGTAAPLEAGTGADDAGAADSGVQEAAVDSARDEARGGGRPLEDGLEISYHLGIDPISGPLLALTGLLVPISVAASFSYIRRREREFYAWLMALTAGMFGVFAARDLLLFYVFFEFTLIPLYFNIGIWGGPERRYAASKFFLYTFAGSMITFAGILYLAARHAALTGGPVTFDLVLLSSLTQLTMNEQILLFFAFFAGFAIKVPFFPLHTWLPLAHTEAPTAGSVLLAGILLKLGTYGFLRFTLPMVPDGSMWWATTMGVLAIAGIIYGALCCWVQRDMKKLVAYSSVSHLGFCMLGMFSMLPVGLSGSVLYMINHGISTGALFLVVGMIYERYHTRDMDVIGGLARRMPVMTTFLLLFAFSSIALPGLNGFVSEFTVLLAAYNSPVLGPSFGIWAAVGIILGAIYMLYMVGKVLFGPLREPPGTPDVQAVLTHDLNRREIAILAPLAVLVVLLGVWPRLVTDSLDKALDEQVLARIVQTPGWQDAERRMELLAQREPAADSGVNDVSLLAFEDERFAAPVAAAPRGGRRPAITAPQTIEFGPRTAGPGPRAVKAEPQGINAEREMLNHDPSLDPQGS